MNGNSLKKTAENLNEKYHQKESVSFAATDLAISAAAVIIPTVKWVYRMKKSLKAFHVKT